jgi:hypothetical protein
VGSADITLVVAKASQMKMNLDRLLSWTLLLSSLCLCASRLPRGTFDDTVVNRTNSHANLLTLAQEFELAAKLEKEPSDKVTHHGYQEMYGTFLLPMLHHRARRVRNRPFKMLEIGLGCDMKYGAGKSISIWKRLLEPEDILWAAELDKKCVSEHEKELRWLQGVLTGDQADETTLLEWVTQTRSGTLPFDVIIDDGGHENHQIYASFKVLFEKSLAPGGICTCSVYMLKTQHAPFSDKNDKYLLNFSSNIFHKLTLVPHSYHSKTHFRRRLHRRPSCEQTARLGGCYWTWHCDDRCNQRMAGTANHPRTHRGKSLET